MRDSNFHGTKGQYRQTGSTSQGSRGTLEKGFGEAGRAEVVVMI